MNGALEYKGKKNRYLLCFIALWVVQMAAALWFCTQKQGFHEDEYYTYYSTARTNGFYVEDGKWVDRDTYRNEFVVLPGQRFQYGLVRQVQSWDVHPPMYYWMFHTIASLTPDVFSKWTGLSVNLFFHGINLILLTYLSYLVSGGDGKLSLLVTFVYGCSPAAMSGVVFIRMYEMLTAFVLLCAILHVRAVKRLKKFSDEYFLQHRTLRNGGKNEAKLSVTKSLLPMAAVTYMGFLTQYYYFIFLFFLAAAFCVWLLWRDRKLWNCLRYGFCQAAAFGLAYLTYPVFPAQMFRGQRGAQATESFFDLSNTSERFWFFWELMNRYVFGGLLGVMVLAMVTAGVVYLWIAGKKRDVLRKEMGAKAERSRPHQEMAARKGVQRYQDAVTGAAYYVLLVAVLGYFAAVSKTALLLGETSVRYQLPIYGIVVLLVFLTIKTLWRRGADLAGMHAGQKKIFAAKYGKGIEVLVIVACVAVIAMGHWRSSVVFLYPEDAAQTAFAEEQAENGVPAMYLYNPGEEWCIWDVTNELLAYPEIYFATAGRADRIADEKIEKAEVLVVYLAKGADADAAFARIFEGHPALGEYRLCFEEKYCDVYYFRVVS